MANDQIITVVGRLTGDPELRFTPAGLAVANFTIASNARTFNAQSNEWKDGPATFWRCDVWREMAENVAESLFKGTGVIAQGRLETKNYETKEGEKRSVLELHVDSIGPDLRWGTAKLAKGGQKAAGGSNGGNFGGQQDGGQGGNFGNFGGPPQPASGFGGGQQQGGGWGATAGAQAGGFGHNEPPF